MKKVILTLLLGAILASTPGIAMDSWEKEKNSQDIDTKSLMNPRLDDQVLEDYEAGKINLGIRNSNRDFVNANETQCLTRQILLAILNNREDSSFWRNGKHLQICGYISDEDEYPDNVMFCFPLDEAKQEGWSFKGWSTGRQALDFEIREVQTSKTEKSTGEENPNDLENEIAELETEVINIFERMGF